MKDNLDRLLAGLGKAEAPEGLERRVLLRLESANPHRRHPLWVWAVATAMLLAGIAAVRIVHTPAVEPGHRAIAEINQPNTQTIAHTVSSEAARRESPRHSERSTPRAMPAQPMEEMEAGFPAPEAPLTEQERLLLRLAQRPTPGTMAMFDDKVQKQRAEAEKAELDELNPPQPLVGPRAEVTENKEIHDEYAKR